MKSLFIIIFISFHAFALEKVTISVDGKLLATVPIEEIKKMPLQEVEFFNSVTKRSELYRGVNTLRFLEKLAMDKTQVMSELELSTTGNFKAYVQADSLRKIPSILSFERADGDTFKRYSSRIKKLINLGPLYLVWNLKGIPGADKLHYTSVYQIEGINLITKTYDLGIKDPSVDKRIFSGFKAYKQNCISCHAIGKTGGDISVDLVSAKTIETKSEEYVRKYILDPVSINPKSQMLPLPKFKNRSEIAQDIVNFLKFMMNPEEYLAKNKEASRTQGYKELQNIIKEELK